MIFPKGVILIIKNVKKLVLTFSILAVLLLANSEIVIAQGYPRGGVRGATQSNQSEIPKEAKITGTIVDGTSNETISYASIAIYNSKDSTLLTGTLSKADGSFMLDKLPYGKFYIVVTFVGYKKHKVYDILLTSGKKTTSLGQIRVNVKTEALKEVEVVGNAPFVTYMIDKKVINIAQNITASGGTVAEALMNAPSIQADVEGNITLRGSSNFLVFIDGRPSPVAGSEGLQQIPANLVQNVELITNPSAKYEAEGSAGIINVIMKKQKLQGSSGMFNITAGTGNKFSSNVNLSYKVSKLSFTLGGDFTDNQSIFKNNSGVTDTLSPQTLKKQLIVGSGNLHRMGKGIRGGIDYTIDTKNALTLTGSMGGRDFIRSTSSDYHDTYSSILNPSATDVYYTNSTHPESERDYKSLNLDYERKFDKKGEQLSAAVYFTGGPSNSVSTLQVDTTNVNWEKSGGSLTQLSEQSSNQTDLRTKIDYELPLGRKGKFGAGYQGKYTTNNADNHLLNYIGNTWTEDSSQRDKVNFTDQIQAGYVTLLNTMPLFDYQLGLRAEYENRFLNQEIQNKESKVSRIDFFPTIHLSKQLPWKLQLLTSYTRRINRPQQSSLNPFILYLNPQTIRQGNPSLLPDFANSFELNLEKKITEASFISVEGFLKETTGLIQQISLFNPTTQITTNTYENIDHDRSMGVECMANLEIYKWFNLNSSFNVFNYHMFGTPVPSVANSTNTWNLHVNPTFHLGKSTTFQATYIYNAPTITAQGTRSGFYTSTMALKQIMLKRKASLTLQARNMFGRTIYDTTTESAHQFKYSSLERESHVLLLTFSYRINNYKAKQNNRRNQDEPNGNREEDIEEP